MSELLLTSCAWPHEKCSRLATLRCHFIMKDLCAAHASKIGCDGAAERCKNIRMKIGKETQR